MSGKKKPAKKQPPTAPKKKPVTRESLTTAVARAEVRDARPPTYDPLETPAPLRPYTYASETTFKYDEFISQRHYARRGLHGENDSRFDPEQHTATAAYKARLEAQPLGVYMDADPLIEAEREANLIEQPPEAQEQLRTDLRNKTFISAIKGPVTRSDQIPADLRRARELEAQTKRTTRRIESQLAQSAGAQDPDFFTSLAGYKRSHAGKTQAAGVSSGNDEALLRVIDQELTEVAENEDDDDNDEERELRRAALEKERADLLKAHNAERREAGGDDDDDLDDKPRNDSEEREPDVHFITTHEARQLLERNPLASLHTDMRTDFLQLPEPAKVWQLLQPIVGQHEPHRQHYNIVEMVRAMDLCGAKYDGCVKLRARARLSDVLDPKYNRSFLHNGKLIGGHEHWCEDEEYTAFTVLKFYLVRRDKTNTEALATKTRAAGAKAADALMDREATNIDNQIDQGRRHMLLNEAGRYDADERPESNENDGTDEFGTLHNIKFLDREFMFSLRVVCVEPLDAAQCEPYNGYVSMEDNDYELPREALAIPPDKDESRAQRSVWSINNEAATNRGTSNTSTSRYSGSGAAPSNSRFEDDEDDIGPDAADAAVYVHSDDDDEHERKAYEAAMQHKPFMPQRNVVLNKEQAEHLVGEWKAPDFAQRVNSHAVGLLCIRSFMFYATTKK